MTTSNNRYSSGSIPNGQNWNYDTTPSNTLFTAHPFPTGNLNYSGGHSQHNPNGHSVNLGIMPQTGGAPPSSDFLDELNKDVQIKMLKERLEFTERLLEEKDKQLENYKKLVDSLREVIAERRAPGLQSSASTGAIPSLTRGPPGFETPSPSQPNNYAPKNTLKGRRTLSTTPEDYAPRDIDQWKKKQDEQLPAYPRKSPSLEYVHDTMAVGSGNPRMVMSSPVSQVEEGFGLFSNPPVSHPRTLHKSASNLESRSPPPLSVSPKNTNMMASFFSDSQTQASIPQAQPVISAPVSAPTTMSPGPSAAPTPIKKVNFGPGPGAPGPNIPLGLLRSSAPVLEGLTPDFFAELAQMEKNANLGKSPHNQPTAVSFSMESDKPLTIPTSPTSGSNEKNKLKKSVSMPSVFSAEDLEPKFLELNQMVGQIYQLSKYQQGCRFLQKRLEEKIAPNTEIIFNELYPHLVELMMDPFGNYLFTKLMECGTSNQRTKVLSKIQPEILNAAFDMYGSQSLQKIMPFLTDQQIDKMIESLKTNTLGLIKHAKANYLVQYCLEHLQHKHNQWIYDCVGTHMIEIACDRVGCVIVKRCIDFASDAQLQALINEAKHTILTLVQDPFGNYVIQHVIQKYPKEVFTSSLIRQLLGHLTDLCVQKFSSNVVEKCLETADADTKRWMLEEITNSDLLPQLLNDRYANFVVQTALDVAEATERHNLVLKIIPHLGKHFSPFTKRLQKKILPLI